MNVEALQQVIRVLREVKSNGNVFNLMGWSLTPREFAKEVDRYNYTRPMTEDQPNRVLQISSQLDTINECGTVHCAMGWCAQDQYFIDKGFTLWNDDCRIYPQYADPTNPDDDPSIGWKAVVRMFDITFSEAEGMFSMFRYDTREETTIDHVIERIATFIANIDELQG